MKPTKIVIPNRRNEKLVGLLHETGSKEVVVLCHGFRSDKTNKILKNVATALEKEKISSFRFDFSGNGDSEGTFYYGNFNSEAEDDLHYVIQHLSSSNIMNRLVPVILGHSKGGDVVLLYASKFPDYIRNVVNISGRFDLKNGVRLGDGYMEKIKEQGFIDATEGKSCFRVTQESLMDRLNTDMHQACLNIDKQCKVLTVHGSDDTVVPGEDAKEFAKVIPNHKLEIVEGANHGYTKHQKELVSIAVEFTKTAIVEQHNLLVVFGRWLIIVMIVVTFYMSVFDHLIKVYPLLVIFKLENVMSRIQQLIYLIFFYLLRIKLLLGLWLLLLERRM
ncbi:Alpha/Beta hydrolase fold [Arabidopsis suecica]|uniref:Alpha/Beta hydrolase fold n=1 Tax=Arabidopsis suecica TaxID=45249 RepID=A0A8T2GDJ2_ARASU|nr:Alpha/Beta hydrolase fold [Arabidopsis suecica]